MRNLVISLSAGLFILVALAPPIFLLIDALFVDGKLSLENYASVLADMRQVELLGNSLTVGGLTCLFACLVGIPFGYLLARVRLALAGFFRCFFLVPVMIPSYIMGITWTEYWECSGLLGIVFLLGICYWPIIALFAERGFRLIDRNLEDAALIDAGPWRVFFTISLRLALPSVSAGALFVFILSIGDFGIPDFLSFASTESYQVYTLEIFNRWSVLDSTGEAIASSLPVIVLAVLAVWGIILLEGRGGVESVTGSFQPPAKRSAGKWSVPVYLFMCIAVGASTFLPLVTLLIWLGRAGGMSDILIVMNEAFDNAGEDILNSIISASLAALLMIVVGFFIAYQIERRKGFWGRFLAFTSLLPLAFPPVMVAVADIRLWNHPDNPLGPLVYGTRTELVLVYFARFIPIAVLSLRATLRQVHPNLEEASHMSGQGYLGTMARVVVPLMWGGFCAAFLLGYVLCMRELDSVALISAGNDTLPQRIYSQVHTSRDVSIGALSVVMIFTLLVPPAVYRLLARGRITMF